MLEIWQFALSGITLVLVLFLALKNLLSQGISKDMCLVPTNSTIASLQARIDELMLEYCPDEMTAEQLEEWAKHQRPATDREMEGFSA